MANKREFKKFAEALGASLCDEMMYAYYYVDGADQNEISKALEKVIVAVEKARVNSNIFFDRSPKSFENPADYRKAKETFFAKLFKKISGEYQAELQEALKQFNAALPAAEKEKNKAAVTAK